MSKAGEQTFLLQMIDGLSGFEDDVKVRLIRTGGEQRLSDFLLWECAYAELVFMDVMWPDFTEAHLQDAVQTFHARQRRFGHVPESESMTG